MDYTVEENIPGLLIFIDFEKAFDSVEWDFLFKCLQAFNFASDFLHWIKTFYTNVQSCIMSNGTASNYFPLERGVLPLSFYSSRGNSSNCNPSKSRNKRNKYRERGNKVPAVCR